MQGYFYGWYFKCQSDEQTVAVIPAMHQVGNKRKYSIQIITNDNTWTVNFPAGVCTRTGRRIFIGRNSFGERGIRLNINTPKVYVKGRIDFGKLSPLKYDIMGPFELVPFMECRHMVLSMKHSVKGSLCINGQDFEFDNAWGYWEGDRGRSFPKEYVWTQCSFWGGSLMLSVADIPIAGFHFNGVIAVVLWRGREYRFATYLGARAVKIQNGIIRIAQGDMELEARVLEKGGRPLKAPAGGEMVRVIRENVSCQAFYRFRKKGHTVFAFKTDKASFEYEYSH